MELKDPEVLEVYSICPNKVYEIQFPLEQGLFVPEKEEDFALFPRKNSHIQCGREGKSSDNCVLRGGQYHILTFASNWPEGANTNIVIQGLTFDLPRAGPLLVGPDHIKFIDCVWRVRLPLIS